jgi:hypothetical protein
VVVGIEQGKIHGAVYILFAYRRGGTHRTETVTISDSQHMNAFVFLRRCNGIYTGKIIVKITNDYILLAVQREKE